MSMLTVKVKIKELKEELQKEITKAALEHQYPEVVYQLILRWCALDKVERAAHQ